MKKPLGLRITDMMSRPSLLGPHFKGDSWNRWRAVIKAAFAEPMSAEEIAAFKEVASREPPKHRVSEAIFAVGRGGGKDLIASLIATSIAVNFDGRNKLRPGEAATVLCIATDRTQAAIVFKYIAGYFEKTAALRPLVKNFGRSVIELKNGVEIVVGTNSFRSIRGRSIICAIFDECAFWRSEESAVPDVEVAGAVAPGLARMQGSMSILISTVYRRTGLLHQRVKESYGKDNDDALAIVGSTLQFNPTFDAKTIERQIAEDGPRFNAEYNSVWREDLSGFIGRDLIEAAVDQGVIVRQRTNGVRYFAFVDASGGRKDSFTLGIAHRNADGTIVLDVAFERHAPFNPSQVVGEVVALARSYGCHEVVGDNYAAGWVAEAFAKLGMKYVKSERVRSDIYLDALPLFASGSIRLLDIKRLVSQFAELERRALPTGRDVVRKPDIEGAHDDLCNAAAGALVLAAAAKANFAKNISSALLARAAAPMGRRLRLGDMGFGEKQPMTRSSSFYAGYKGPRYGKQTFTYENGEKK